MRNKKFSFILIAILIAVILTVGFLIRNSEVKVEKIFPLKVGNYWVYDEITSGQKFTRTIKVVSFSNTKESFNIFKLEQNVSVGEVQIFYYIIVKNKVFKIDQRSLDITFKKPIEDLGKDEIINGGLLMYVFPMRVNEKWKLFKDAPSYNYVTGKENMMVAVESFSNASKIQTYAVDINNTTDIVRRTEWFYPGIGLIKYETYSADGLTRTGVGELKDYKIE